MRWSVFSNLRRSTRVSYFERNYGEISGKLVALSREYCNETCICNFKNSPANSCNYIADENIRQWFLMSSPYVPITIAIIYYTTVCHIGPKIMQNRKPFNISNLILAYNFFQIVINGYLCAQVNFMNCSAWDVGQCSENGSEKNPAYRKMSIGTYRIIIYHCWISKNRSTGRNLGKFTKAKDHGRYFRAFRQIASTNNYNEGQSSCYHSV